MNRLQRLSTVQNLFVTLNPIIEPDEDKVLRRESYAHPLFNSGALSAQHQLPSLQGERNTWFCGAYFGSGFHEDGLCAGLAVAEALGGVLRPWQNAASSQVLSFRRTRVPEFVS
jgi:predicted NAD/FAD-binding protein